MKHVIFLECTNYIYLYYHLLSITIDNNTFYIIIIIFKETKINIIKIY
jgi:hypothetical protein